MSSKKQQGPTPGRGSWGEVGGLHHHGCSGVWAMGCHPPSRPREVGSGLGGSGSAEWAPVGSAHGAHLGLTFPILELLWIPGLFSWGDASVGIRQLYPSPPHVLAPQPCPALGPMSLPHGHIPPLCLLSPCPSLAPRSPPIPQPCSQGPIPPRRPSPLPRNITLC